MWEKFPSGGRPPSPAPVWETPVITKKVGLIFHSLSDKSLAKCSFSQQKKGRLTEVIVILIWHLNLKDVISVPIGPN